MGLVDDILEYLRGMDTVVLAYEMDDELSKKIESTENNIGTRVNTDYKNVGYYVAMQKKHRIAVIYKDGFPYNSLSTLKLIGGGKIIGTTLRPEEIPEYKKRDDVMWISEDFVLFPNIKGSGEEAFVLYPAELPEFSKMFPGCRDAVAVSPTTSSDTMLKEKAGFGTSDNIFTAVIAFDD